MTLLKIVFYPFIHQFFIEFTKIGHFTQNVAKCSDGVCNLK